ncbi:hypothetical protein B0E43_13780 [Algoriphagus sp. A40]|nr:hypothetical protein B0E43_13780 [Algoriphagus sp. A40]
METLQINILDPKAKKLLEDLADLNLIEIKPAEIPVLDAYSRIKSKFENAPISEEEIFNEVEDVRRNRYGASKV